MQLYILLFVGNGTEPCSDMNILRPDNLVFPNLADGQSRGAACARRRSFRAASAAGLPLGIFPWTDEPLTWWSPDPRAIFEIDRFRPPKRLESKLREPSLRAHNRPRVSRRHPRLRGTGAGPRIDLDQPALHRRLHRTAPPGPRPQRRGVAAGTSWSAGFMAWPSRAFSPGSRCFTA